MNQLLFLNARVLTMDPARPRAEAIAVRDGRIAAVGSSAEARRALDGEPERIDCAGQQLLPAFIDAHCHLLAYAASLRSVDCTGARSISDIQDLIRAGAAGPGGWLRAYGYEETALAERRHPTRHDLDAAAPTRPVRLIHRSGHASVLNSQALRAAGISIATEEPPGGFIDRETGSGEPSGLLLGMERTLERAVPRTPHDVLAASVLEAAQRFLRAGVTVIQDATHTNGRAEWELFARLIEEGSLPLDVVLMEGIDHLGELPETACGGRLRRGAVKIMVHELGDELAPDEAELERMVWEVHAAGRQAAVHAVGSRAVAAAAAAIEAALKRSPRPGHRHRIEHCSRLPAGAAPMLAALGIVVVSQPSFVYERGERYLQLIPESERSGLYAFRTLRAAGVTLAAGSDAPVTAPDPLRSAAAAVQRRTAGGRRLAAEEAVDYGEALEWWTAGAAYAGFLSDQSGSLRPGRRADLVLLSSDSSGAPSCTAGGPSVRRVWRAGQEIAPALDSEAEHK